MHILKITEYSSFEYQVVYNSTSLLLVLSYTVSSLESGSFQTYAMNFKAHYRESDAFIFNVYMEIKGLHPP